MSPEEILKTGEIDPDFLEAFHPLVQKLNIPKPQWNSVAESRELFRKRQALGLEAMGPTPSDMIEEDQHIPVKDGSKIRIRVIKHKNASGRPLVVLFHGGGFVSGSLEGEQANARSLVRAFDAVCVSVGYRLAPEHKFPTAIDDAWDALRWTAENATALGADPSEGFIVGGSSAGGNIAAVLAHLARDENLTPPLTGQGLCIPAVLNDVAAAKVLPEKYKKLYLSYEQNSDPPGLGKVGIDFFMEQYAPDADDPKYNPFLWPGGHKGQPPAYFQVCGADPLRDEALLYELVMREEAGIPTKLDIYPGLPHGFWAVFPMFPAAKKVAADLVKGYSWLLGIEPAKVETEQVTMAV
ncbi:MAG: hypothetical protein M1822_005137 [Bathelium mastoideum]|nr:MAG: hypothetical protein M1822_005137 [Bathelium mastoideum]